MRVQQIARLLILACLPAVALLVAMYVALPMDKLGMPIGADAMVMRAAATIWLALASWLILTDASDPRRSWLTLLPGMLVGVLGCLVFEAVIWLVTFVM